MTALATTLQAFFTDRLIRQRQASPHTLAAYRDSLRLLLVFASARQKMAPSKLDIDDLDAPLVGAFLDHLEHQRENGVRTRNARLAAIRSLFRYAALRHPEYAAVIERVLAIPPKRFDRRLVTFLTEAELDALLAAPARSTWTGRRDHALFGLAAQTGLRASELIGLRRADVHLGAGAHVSAWARDESCGSPRSRPASSPSCAAGSPSAPAKPKSRYSQTRQARFSAVTLWSTVSPNPWRLPPTPVRQWVRKPSPCTYCVIPRRCDCYALASTLR
jgi:integrase